MKVAYVAGPYRGDGEWAVKQNIERAEKIALELWKMGYAVICPHKNTAFFGGAADDSVWLDGDIEIMKRCDLVVMTPDWDESSGAREEYRIAYHELFMPVFEYGIDAIPEPHQL